MHRFFSVIVAVALMATTAVAGSSKVIYRHKAWQVSIAAFDDGSVSCVAQVRPSNGTTFAIWADGNRVKLQFYSNVWNFGNSSANVVARIDRRAGWNLSNSNLYKNSVIFTMPSNNNSTRFLLEVARGNTLYLNQPNGRMMGRWSLAGSKASISKLIDCARLL